MADPNAVPMAPGPGQSRTPPNTSVSPRQPVEHTTPPEDYRYWKMERLRKDAADAKALATEELQATLDHPPTPSEIEIAAQAYAKVKMDGFDYWQAKRIINTEPPDWYKAAGRGVDAVSSIPGRVLDAGKRALTDRTASLRTQDSSLPSVELNLGSFGKTLSTLQNETGFNQPVGPAFNGMVPEGFSFTPPDLGGTYRLGAEQIADVIEVGVPMIGEVAAAYWARTPAGFIQGTLLANTAPELAAEGLRIWNRSASNLPNTAVDTSNPIDMALHLTNTAAGGVILGVGSTYLNRGVLKTQRGAYKLMFGLNTKVSDEQLARFKLLGVDPALAQAATGVSQAMTAAFGAFPLTARRARRQSLGIIEKINSKMNMTIANLGDETLSGLFLHDKSAAYLQIHDEYLQLVRKRGSAAYSQAGQIVDDATRQFGLDAVHVPFAAERKEIQDFVTKAAGEGPLAQTVDQFGHHAPPLESITKTKGYEFLERAMNLPDKVSITEFAHLRNELNRAAKKLSKKEDLNSAVFIMAASKMREAMKNMVAPAGIKTAWASADRAWLDMHSLLSDSTWKHFKAAHSRFGKADKIGETSSKSAEIVLQDTLNDGRITPGVVKTLFRTAKDANAENYYKTAIEAHFRQTYDDAISVATTGPLAGVEVINFNKLERSWGLDSPTKAKWHAHMKMIETSGGNPHQVAEFIKQAKLAFPDGIQNPSKMATRRAGLAGIQSAAKAVTGIGALGTVRGGPVTGAMSGLAGLIGLVGIGELFFNPNIAAKMIRVMKGGVNEQGKFRIMFSIASSVGVTRAFQDYLQGHGIDAYHDPRVIDRNARTERMRAVTLDNLRITPFDRDPLLPDPKTKNASPLPRRPEIGPAIQGQ